MFLWILFLIVVLIPTYVFLVDGSQVLAVCPAPWAMRDAAGGAILLQNSLVPWDNDIRRFARGFGYGYENTAYEKFCTRPTGGANLLMFRKFVERSTNLRSGCW